MTAGALLNVFFISFVNGTSIVWENMFSTFNSSLVSRSRLHVTVQKSLLHSTTNSSQSADEYKVFFTFFRKKFTPFFYFVILKIEVIKPPLNDLNFFLSSSTQSSYSLTQKKILEISFSKLKTAPFQFFKITARSWWHTLDIHELKVNIPPTYKALFFSV